MNGLYQWLLLGHILAAMVWVGGAVLLGVLAVRASRDADPGAVGRFVSGMRVVGPRVLAPATIAVVGLGVWMVLHSAAWDFGQFWVQLALVLFAGAFVMALPIRAGRRSVPSEPRTEGMTTRRVASSPGGRGATGRSLPSSSSRPGT